MSKQILIILLIGLGAFITSCKSSEPYPDYKVGEGVEIYLAKQLNSFDWDTDYTQINLDTIQLREKPFIRYNDIKKYDLQNHTMELQLPFEDLDGFQQSVYGHMFIVTLDGKKIYAGFLIPLLSSVSINWVMISEPIDGRSNKLPIYFRNQDSSKDPRLNNELVERLRKDKKLL